MLLSINGYDLVLILDINFQLGNIYKINILIVCKESTTFAVKTRFDQNVGITGLFTIGCQYIKICPWGPLKPLKKT